MLVRSQPKLEPDSPEYQPIAKTSDLRSGTSAVVFDGVRLRADATGSADAGKYQLDVGMVRESAFRDAAAVERTKLDDWLGLDGHWGNGS